MKVYELFILYGIKLLGKREYRNPSCWCQPTQPAGDDSRLGPGLQGKVKQVNLTNGGQKRAFDLLLYLL